MHDRQGSQMTASLKDHLKQNSWLKYGVTGYFAIAVTFLGLGVWAAYARLDAAVVAPGTINVETNRKTVQHYEGGIVKEIHVREGQRVNEGDILFRLDPVQATASAEIHRNQLDTFIAINARLRAEQAELPNIEFPSDLTDRTSNHHIASILLDQKRQFSERRASIQGQVGILEERILQLRREIQGLSVERDATSRQISKLRDELVGLRYLLAKELVQVNRVYALEREESRLEGVMGRSVADIAKAEGSISEARLQIQQIKQKFAEEVASSLAETRQKIAEVREKLNISEDIARRLEIIAPQTGMVQNLRVFTQGAVIRSGEALLDIVPEDEGLLIHAQVAPTDSAFVYPGQTAEIRLTAFPQREMPLVQGHIKSVSRDRLIDEASKQPYFLVQIAVDMKSVPEMVRGRLSAGMPADVIIPTGERTALDYIITPLIDRARKSMREH